MTPAAILPDGILDISGDVVYFPVRHHSPAAARLVGQLIDNIRPKAVLIEGPSDFNEHFDELYLDHKLPIAIYSYVAAEKSRRLGAFYPFCIYSPEWQALMSAHRYGIPASFIDLPWADVMKLGGSASNRYADGEMRSSEYVANLCRAVGVEDLDALWDTMFEIEPDLTISDYMRRCHQFCFNVRSADSHVPVEDIVREAFMASQIRVALHKYGGSILVVTGGFHSSALCEQIKSGEQISPPSDPEIEQGENQAARGIALTPYSYRRLDGLNGYNSGMPNPGFYHQAWEDGDGPGVATCQTLLAEAASELRRRGQKISSADLIAVKTTASALASIRGHARIWRRDLIDGIIGSLIKDEMSDGDPFLAVIYEVFRGSQKGMLSNKASLPPLVHDIRRRLNDLGLELGNDPVEISISLGDASGLDKSRTLHALRLLGISGIVASRGPDFFSATGPSTALEMWKMAWLPEMDAAIIEASIYGASLFEAASACLSERAHNNERSAEAAALILLDAGQAGLFGFADEYRHDLLSLIQQDGDFFRVAKALKHLLYLYRYDEFLGTANEISYGDILSEAYGRVLWLLETVGQASGRQEELMAGVASIVETVRRCRGLELSRQELVDVLRRVSQYGAANPALCGAVRGALWTMGDLTADDLVQDFQSMSQPDVLGDFLTGLFHLARETVQRHPELVTSLDSTLNGYSLDEFMEALPSLRLAFSYFAPREKHHMARTLLAEFGIETPIDDITSVVDIDAIAGALRFEEALFGRLRLYGIRGGFDE